MDANNNSNDNLQGELAGKEDLENIGKSAQKNVSQLGNNFKEGMEKFSISKKESNDSKLLPKKDSLNKENDVLNKKNNDLDVENNSIKNTLKNNSENNKLLDTKSKEQNYANKMSNLNKKNKKNKEKAKINESLGLKIKSIKVKFSIALIALFIILSIVLVTIIISFIDQSSHTVAKASFYIDGISPIGEGNYTITSGYGWRLLTKSYDEYKNKISLTSATKVYSSDTIKKTTCVPTKTICESIFGGFQGSGSCPSTASFSCEYSLEINNTDELIGYKGKDKDGNNYFYDINTGIVEIANFHKGIDLAAEEGTEIYAIEPGVVESIVSDDESYGNYIVINHTTSLAEGEGSGVTIKTLYAHMSSFGKFIKDDEIVLEDTVGYVGSTGNSTGPHLHFEFIQNDKNITPNWFFGYDSPNAACTDESADLTVKAIKENSCNNLPKQIDIDEGKNRYSYGFTCSASDTGVARLPQVSGICGGIFGCQCAAGVYQYFNSILPLNYPDIWEKFNQIYGNAIDYWNNNEKLQLFTTSSEPIPGSLWVTSFSNAKNSAGVPYGHIMAVLGVEGENVDVWECNYNSLQRCWYHTYTATALASRKGFLGYINILGCGEGAMSSNSTFTCSENDKLEFSPKITVSNSNKLSVDFTPKVTSVPAEYSTQSEQLTCEALDAFIDMSDACYAATGYRLKVLSGYRSYLAQARNCCSATSCNEYTTCPKSSAIALPGESEHQTGLAVDISGYDVYLCTSTQKECDNELDEKAFKWLQGNAATYGYKLSYPYGNSSGYGYEPWHWRYWGR